MKIHFKSIGCRTNQEEIITLKSALCGKNFTVEESVANADIIIVNTCSVTSHTESKTRRLITSLSKDAPRAKILVTGCFAQQHGAELLKIANVKWVVGNYEKYKIPEILGGCLGDGVDGVDNLDLGGINNDVNNSVNNFGTGGVFLSGEKLFLSDGVDVDKLFDVENIQSPELSGRTRFALKIQEGCDYKCAYCIVPSLRGRSRSASAEKLIDTFKRAVDVGYKEIVLTGTHIGQYKNDNENLESLLEKFLKIDGDFRIRLSSLDPRDLSDNIIELAGNENRVCEHLHVSVQSLSYNVLSRMGRLYNDSNGFSDHDNHHNIEKFFDKLCNIRKKYPNMGLGGDFIVGHPGETDEMFEETLRRIETVDFTYGHVFRYSKRAGTSSANMTDQVAESVKKNRAEKLRAQLSCNRKKFLLQQTLRPLYIIVEKENPAFGISGNYLKVELSGVADKKNSWLCTHPTENRRVI